MSESTEFEILARLASLFCAALLIPFSIALAISQAIAHPRAEEPSRETAEVVLPPEMQTRLFHSLPIAGLMVTPDQIAQLMTLNPRLRVTTGMPLSGKGVAMPSKNSDVVDTPAEPRVE